MQIKEHMKAAPILGTALFRRRSWKRRYRYHSLHINVSIPENTELLFGKLFGKIFNEI